MAARKKQITTRDEAKDPPSSQASPPVSVGRHERLIAAARETVAQADRMRALRGPHTERFAAAVEALRETLPPLPPELVPEQPPPPRTQEEWMDRVLEWARECGTTITLTRALIALAPEAAIGSPEHNAIAAALGRLPQTEFEISWFLANTALTAKWTRKKKPPGPA